MSYCIFKNKSSRLRLLRGRLFTFSLSDNDSCTSALFQTVITYTSQTSIRAIYDVLKEVTIQPLVPEDLEVILSKNVKKVVSRRERSSLISPNFVGRNEGVFVIFSSPVGLEIDPFTLVLEVQWNSVFNFNSSFLDHANFKIPKHRFNLWLKQYLHFNPSASEGSSAKFCSVSMS